MLRDQSREFLEKFVELFEDMLNHDGYGDIGVQVRLGSGNVRRVTLQSGKSYEFVASIDASPNLDTDPRRPRFRVVDEADVDVRQRRGSANTLSLPKR